MRTVLRAWRRSLRWGLLLALMVSAALGLYLRLYAPPRFEARSLLVIDSEGLTQAQAGMMAESCARWVSGDEVRGRVAQADWTRAWVARLSGSTLLELRVIGKTNDAAVQSCRSLASALCGYVNELSLTTGLAVAEDAESAGRFPASVVPWALAAFAAVFALWALAALPLCARRPRLSWRDDLESVTGLPVLARTPDTRSLLREALRCPGRGTLLEQADAVTTREIRALALYLNRRKREQGLCSAVLASREPDEGKSALAVMLAQALCAQGARVLLIDMDGFTPTLSRLLRRYGRFDLSDYLSGGARLEQVLMDTPTEGLYFIDQCHDGATAARAAALPAFRTFLERAKAQFDYILFDSPPVEAFSEAAALGGAADAVLLAVANERSTRRELVETVRRLSRLGCETAGIVVTKVKCRQPRWYRDDEDEGRAMALDS